MVIICQSKTSHTCSIRLRAGVCSGHSVTPCELSMGTWLRWSQVVTNAYCFAVTRPCKWDKWTQTMAAKRPSQHNWANKSTLWWLQVFPLNCRTSITSVCFFYIPVPPLVCVCVHCMSMSVCAFRCADVSVWVAVVISLQGLTPWVLYVRLMNLNANWIFCPVYMHTCVSDTETGRQVNCGWYSTPTRCTYVCLYLSNEIRYRIDLAVCQDWE